jgi:holliday junction DNA helicase RuvB
MRLAARRGDNDMLAYRPAGFSEFAGQTEVVRNLRVMIEAARQREEPLEHLLFSGPPGLGKTTLAHLIANEMGASIMVSSGPILEIPGDLVGILTKLRRGQILFIDEIHRLRRPIEEILYSAMEDFRAEWVTGTGPGGATQISLPLERFTLIGATTRSGLLSAPLRDRFGGLFHLEFYTSQELTQIIARVAPRLGIELDDAARLHLAEHSRGTPRIALRLLRRIRDYAQLDGSAEVGRELCATALEQLGIGALGLDRMDRALLDAVINRFGGGPVGLDTLAAVFNEERDVLAEVHEPYLMKIGFLQRTPRGRIATAGAYIYLGLKPPIDAPSPLFEE